MNLDRKQIMKERKTLMREFHRARKADNGVDSKDVLRGLLNQIHELGRKK